MWPRSRRNKENLLTTAYQEFTAPVSSDTARHLGAPAIFGLAVAESSPRDAEIRAFDQLRTDTHALMRSEYAHRTATAPTPTQRELSLGMYAENLEPQVRNATLQMRDKGYQTRASGFFHGDVTWRILGIEGEDVPWDTYATTVDPVNKRAQTMDSNCEPGFQFDSATTERLHEIGAEVIYHPQGDTWRIGFVPDAPDINAIAATWDAIASALPDTGSPAPAAETFYAGFADWGATTAP